MHVRENNLVSQTVANPNLLALTNIMTQFKVDSLNFPEEQKPVSQEKEKKAEKPKKEATVSKVSPALENFSRVKFVVGLITKIYKHETADKLYCEEIDIGSEVRKIASGLVPFYPDPNVLLNKRVLVVANLKEKKLVGFPSHGMVLCTSNSDKSSVKILDPPTDANLGDVVTVDGLGSTDWDGGAKKITTSWEEVAKLLKTDSNGVAKLGDLELKVNGKTMKSEITNGTIS